MCASRSISSVCLYGSCVGMMCIALYVCLYGFPMVCGFYAGFPMGSLFLSCNRLTTSLGNRFKLLATMHIPRPSDRAMCVCIICTGLVGQSLGLRPVGQAGFPKGSRRDRHRQKKQSPRAHSRTQPRARRMPSKAPRRPAESPQRARLGYPSDPQG